MKDQTIPPPTYSQRPPAYYPPSGFRFEVRTEKGLRFLNFALWMNMLTQVLILILLAAFIFNFENFIAIGLLSLGYTGAGLLFFVLWIVGFVFMYYGRQEFGPAHAHKVKLAFIFFIMAIIVAVVSTLYIYIILFSSGPFMQPGMEFESFESRIYSFMMVGIGFGFFTNLFLSLMWIYLIMELVVPKMRNLLWFYFGVSISVYILSSLAVFSLYYLERLGSNFVGALGIIGLIFLIYCYQKTYDRIRKREIEPVPPPGFYPPPYPVPPQVDYPVGLKKEM